MDGNSPLRRGGTEKRGVFYFGVRSMMQWFQKRRTLPAPPATFAGIRPVWLLLEYESMLVDAPFNAVTRDIIGAAIEVQLSHI